MDYIDNFLKMEINVIVAIQDKFFHYENLLGLLSTFFGPVFLYLYAIPILSSVNTKLYQRLLISCQTTDFINCVLKWILNEDRPYWWVHETNSYTSLTRPVLYQNERTCETSGGSPSGHMMLASCFLYILYEEINAQIDKKFTQLSAIKLRVLNRISIITILTLVAVSRMYIAAHFLHQCIFGCILGIITAKLLSEERFAQNISKQRKRDWMKIALIMTILVVSIYWVQKLLSGNPMKTVQLAFKHCQNPLYPSPDTTVVFSALRSIAMICGIMLTAPIEQRITSLNLKRSILVTVVLAIAQTFVISNTPKLYKIVVFYSYSFIAYALFQFLYFFIIPKYCAKTEVKKDKEN